MALEDVEVGDEPLEYRQKLTSFPQIPEEMVASIALGMEDELIVAARHGFSVETYQALSAQPWFQLQVAVKRADLEKNGVTTKAKAAWMTADLLDKAYLMAADNNASFNQVMEAIKVFSKLGGLEPKDQPKEATGPSFQISIDLGGGQSISLSTDNAQPAPQMEPITLDVPARVREDDE
jgi:hypothetical protein